MKAAITCILPNALVLAFPKHRNFEDQFGIVNNLKCDECDKIRYCIVLGAGAVTLCRPCLDVFFTLAAGELAAPKEEPL